MSDQIIKMCVDRVVPENKFLDSVEKAIQENPDNAPMRFLEPDNGNPIARMAAVTRKLWKPGRTLRIKFLSGETVVQQKVEQVSHEWEKHAHIKFQFVPIDADAEIRIDFMPNKGSWSYLGTDALVIAEHEPTMNYGWLTPDSDMMEYNRVVLHEFGHALGCIHEHQHPEAGIPWDREAVYQYYKRTNGWSRQQVDHNLFLPYSRSITNFSEYDASSIMHYPVDDALTQGDWAVGWNTTLSAIDKEHIGILYPKEDKGVVKISIGQTIEGSIGKHKEIDFYSFEIKKPYMRCRIETHGDTDVVMAVYGPNSDTWLMAEDDDSGKRYNAHHPLFSRRYISD